MEPALAIAGDLKNALAQPRAACHRDKADRASRPPDPAL